MKASISLSMCVCVHVCAYLGQISPCVICSVLATSWRPWNLIFLTQSYLLFNIQLANILAFKYSVKH